MPLAQGESEKRVSSGGESKKGLFQSDRAIRRAAVFEGFTVNSAVPSLLSMLNIRNRDAKTRLLFLVLFPTDYGVRLFQRLTRKILDLRNNIM